MSAKRGTIGAVLWFWVVVLVALIGGIAMVAAGRGDSMAEVYDDRPDASLPGGRPLNADDLRLVRLNTGFRGYRMDEVDALLARLEAEMLEREDRADVRVGPPPDQPASSEVGTSESEPAPVEPAVVPAGVETVGIESVVVPAGVESVEGDAGMAEAVSIEPVQAEPDERDEDPTAERPGTR